MRGMFYGCENLRIIDFNKFNTSNVTNMKWMFHTCKSFEKLNLSHFSTEKVIDMEVCFISAII